MCGKPKVLITGGFGNLGSWLCNYFYNIGFEVTVLSQRVRSIAGVNYHHVIQADIADYGALKSKITMSYDYCIHTASYNEHFHKNYHEKALFINALGTRNLVEVLKCSGLKKFIYFSTFHVYGKDYNVIDEGCAPSPHNDYATTHLFAEYYLKQFYNTDQFPSIICRLTNSYGAPKSLDSSKWYLVLNDLVKSAYESHLIKISSNGEASRDFVWMGDVCQVVDKLLSSTVDTGIFNISSGQTCKVIELARVVQSVYQKRYKKKIDIVTNNKDINKYCEVEVKNDSLLEVIKHTFHNELEGEVVKIFNLLESRNV